MHTPRTVLGIDAAWTLTQPSGVALVVEEAEGWRLGAVAASYREFEAMAEGRTPDGTRPSGSVPDAHALLATAARLAGGSHVSLVAIDMPLARSPIVGRRVSDNLLSSAYGGRKCGTHSPSALRPGRISDELREGFERAGYPLQTESIAPRGLIEVYPHPALVELARAAERLPYKVAKIRRYWPSDMPAARRTRLLQQWSDILKMLEHELAGVGAQLPMPDANARGAALKAWEDKLDAVVCAWIAICALKGRAKPFGDAESAIWVPLAGVAVNSGLTLA
jgi:predicted RNase H-like nuclease